MKIWPDHKKASAQPLIDWLISEMGKKGWPVNWVNEIAFVELSSLSESKSPRLLALS